MSGRGRLALAAMAATLLTAGALVPLVDNASWLVQATALLAVQTGVGAAARRVPLARPLTVAVQALVTLLILTAMFAGGRALAGVLPGPEALREFGVLLQTGADDVGRYSIPAPLTEGIKLMLIGGVLTIGLAVDALAVTFRSAAPAGLPLLALYSVAAGIADGSGGWVWFLLAAAGYLLLLLAEGRDRLSQWGRVFGGAAGRPGAMASGLAAGGGALAPVRTGRRIGAVALGVALVAPAALPALDGGLLDGVGDSGGSGGSGGTISAVNPLVSLKDSLNQPSDREVLTYRTNSEETKDLYLRIVALDRFDGTAWKPEERSISDVPSPFPTPPGLKPGVRTTTVQTSISAADWYAQDWLPMPYPATRVDIDGRWRFEEVGRTLVGDRGQTTRGKKYQVDSLLVQPTAEQLASAPPAPEALASEFTAVPDSLPRDVFTTARQVTLGAANDYERAVRLQDWFAAEGGFTYNTRVDAGSGARAISRFLERKEGFCVHFSFAMASMARTLDIPARVAVGFTPGSPSSDGTMSVGLKDAHAWPELYFEGVGWTRFEPTPTRGSVPEYTVEETPSSDPSASAAPAPSQSLAPEDEPSASASDDCPAELRRLGECENDAAVAIDDAGGGPPLGTVVGLTLAALVVLTVPLLPMLWRIRVRARRLGVGGRSDADVTARTLAAWREMTDTAWDYGIVPDDSQTPRKAAARIVRVGALPTAAADSVHRVAAAVEQVLYAPRPLPAAGLGEDVRRLRAGLRDTTRLPGRLRAVLAPRSAVRVAWTAAARWAALKRRWNLGGWAGQRWAALLRRPSKQQG
ncbi:transglutaminase TgpA family protein [Streptomyces sp. O3]